MPLDSRQSESGWVDYLGIPLTLVANSVLETMGFLSETEDQFALVIHNNHLERRNFQSSSNVLCMKCSGYYSVPTGYDCLDTDFGIVVIKAYTTKHGHRDAKRLCSADASYLHLPAPTSEAQNQWYLKYAKSLGLDNYWLGITDKDRGGKWLNNEGDPQTYFDWATGQPDDTRANKYKAVAVVKNSWDDVRLFSKRQVLCSYIITNP